MRIISSQHFLNEEIVTEKKKELIKNNITEVYLPVYRVRIDDLYILIDGHHTRKACSELGILVKYEIIPNRSWGYKLLDDERVDGWYYDIETGEEFDL